MDSTHDDSLWYGVPFVDLDCRHWLPFLTSEELGREAPKLVRNLRGEGSVFGISLPEYSKAHRLETEALESELTARLVRFGTVGA